MSDTGRKPSGGVEANGQCSNDDLQLMASGSGGGASASGSAPLGAGGIFSKALAAVKDGWLDLPPQQESIPLLRLSAVLLRLSDMIYTVDDSHVGSTISIDVPLRGPDGERAPVTAKLIEFRAAVCGEGASEQMPEQFGLWSVQGVGLVVAFRGTASYEDVLVDVNIKPAALKASHSMRGMHPLMVHAGMYHGVSRHLPTIQEAIAHAESDAASSQDGEQAPPPVWLTGHSLGGGYANCVMLHLLATKSCAELFRGGGGCITFGAPMVLYSTDPNEMYTALHKLEEAAQKAAGRDGMPPFQVINYVNGSDIVPRILGASLANMHESVATYYSFLGRLTSGTRATARAYHPFGTYHFILGAEVRTPQHDGATGGGIGDAAYAAKIQAQLDITAVTKAALRGAVKSPAHDHFLASYAEGLKGTLDALAAKAEADDSESAEQPETLFRLAPPVPPTASLHEGLGRSAGRSAGQAAWGLAAAAAGYAGNVAVAYMNQPGTKIAPDSDGQPAKQSVAAAWGSWLASSVAPKQQKPKDSQQ